MSAVSGQDTGSVANGVTTHRHLRELPYEQKQYHDPLMNRAGTSKSQKIMERGLSRDASSLRRTLSSNEDTSPTALPLLLTMVEGPGRLPGDENLQEVLRGKLRIVQADSAAVNSLFTELSTHLVSVNSEENAIFVTFRTFEEIWRFTTYYTIGFLGQCMECLLFDQDFWLSSLDHDHMGIEVSILEDTLHLMYRGLLMQEGSLFASCSSNQMFDSSTSGGDLYLEQGDIAQFEPPFLGSGWTVLSLADGARGTKPKPALEPVVPFYQWFLKSCPENILVGGGKPACDFPLQFATGTCLATTEYIAEGPDELSVAPGDRIIIMGFLVSCFDWFMGRMETTGAMGLVKTCLVRPANDICDSPDIFLDKEERTLFSLKEEQIIEDTIALLKKMSQNDVGYIYKLDLIDQQEETASASVSSSKVDTDHSEMKLNIERILRQEPAPSCNSTPTAGIKKTLEETEPSNPKLPCFTVHPVIEGTCNIEGLIPLITFLDSCEYKAEFGVLYEQTPEGLASTAFEGHADEDELTSFLAVARETARKKRLYWSQSRLCFMLGKLCAGRSKFSQARVYFEEALSVPREGFRDMTLVASIYADLAAIYLKQKNSEKYFALAERIAALVTAIPECIACMDNDSEILKFLLKKAFLSHNKMAEARACFLLARGHLRRDAGTAAAPYVERLLVLYAEHSGAPSVSPSHGYLSLGRLYRAFSRPHLSVSAARRASRHPSVTLGDCLGGLALVLENAPGLLWARAQEGAMPTVAVAFMRQALSFLEQSPVAQDDGDVAIDDDGRGRYHALGRALTLSLSQLLRKHGRTGLAVRAVRALVGRGRPPPGLMVAERNAALLWLAWLHLSDRQPQLAVDVLDAILAAMPEHCTTTQEGLVLNMRGVALRHMGDLRRAAESYQAAINVCEEFEDRPNWAVALANMGLLCLKAGAKRLAERHLTRAVELFSALQGEGHEARFASVLLALGEHHVGQGRLEYGKGCLEWALLLTIKADLSDCQLSATRRLCHLYGTVSPDRAQCIIYNEHQLNLLRSRGDTAQEACVLETISQLYLSVGSKRAYKTALDYTKRSLGIFIDLGRREKEAYGWLQAGKIYHMLGQIELVDLYVQVAQDVALNTGDTNFILELLEAAGDVFFNSSQDRDKAVCFYRDRALPIAVKTGNINIKLRLCNKLVDLMLSLKLYGEAVEFAHTALDISISLGERLKERVAYHRLATLYHCLGQFELAEHHYLKALALCPAALQFDEETLYYVRVYQTLGDITFYDLKDPHDAAGYYHLALAAAMDLGNKRSQLQLCTRLATIYHNFLVDRELSLFFYQKARGFAADLNVRRINISSEQRFRRPAPYKPTWQ